MATIDEPLKASNRSAMSSALDIAMNNKPQAQYQEGRQVDLGGLKTAVESYKPGESQFNMQGLKDTMNKQQTNGQTVSTDLIKNNLGTKPGDTFNLGQLQQSIDSAKSAGSGMAQPTAAQYQNPEQFQKILTQMNQVLAPLTQVQKDSANSAYGAASQQLQNKWAGNGLLASGAAMTQQMQGANQLAGQMAAIDATQQANALNQSFNFANLSLAEDAQKYSQNADSRNFAAQQAQNNVNNIASGLNQQNGMQQNWMNNASNLTQMDIAQNQWSQNYGMQQKQNEVANMLSALGMQEQQIQNYLNNKQDVTQMDVSQNQWAQQFGLQRQAQDASQQQSYLNTMLQANQQDTASNQWQTAFDYQKGQDQISNDRQTKADNWNAYLQMVDRTGNMGSGPKSDWGLLASGAASGTNGGMTLQGQAMAEQIKNSNWNAYKDSVNMTGQLGTGPKSDWGQLTQGGGLSYQAQQDQMNTMLNQANQYPYMQQNMGQYMQNMPAYSGMKDFLNNLGGQANQSWLQQQGTWQRQDTANGIDQQRVNQSGAAESNQNTYRKWQMSQGDQALMGEKNTNSWIAEAISQSSPDAAYDWIMNNAAEAAQAGVDVGKVQDAIRGKWGTQNSGQQQSQGNLSDVDKKAIDTATQDPSFQYLSPAEQKAKIDQYRQMYSGG